MNYWQDKVSVITGGSAGLGLAIARELAAQGGTIVLAARQPAALEEASALVQRDTGRRAVPVPTDVTRPADVEALLAKTLKTCGRVDALFNCAGRSARGQVLDTTPDDFRELLELNFLSLVQCTQTFMPQLLETQGHLVNIGSLAAKSASRFLGAYPASKFPMAAYSQQLRLELTDRGVHVLLVCPGPIRRSDAGQRYEQSNVPAAARQPGGGVKLQGIPPGQLAKRILTACVKRRPELVIPAKARLLFAISQLAPSWGDWIVRKMTN